MKSRRVRSITSGYSRQPFRLELLEPREVPAGIGPANIVTHDDVIPNFGSDFQTAGRQVWISSGNVRWADEFAAAGPEDVILIQNDITFDGSANVHTVVIEPGGALRFMPNANTNLNVVDLEVLEGGLLEVGTVAAPVTASAIITIKDVPLDTVRDPSQYGNGLIALGTVHMHGRYLSDTFVRLAAEPLAGQNTLRLSSPVTGWQVGDKIALPDTHQLDWWEQHNHFDEYLPQWENFTISAISADGLMLTLDHKLAFDHLGAHDPDGTLRFLPHVALLSRNVVVRSANSLGTRGHALFTGRADVDIRDVQFSGLGRTTNAEYDNSTYNADGSVAHLGTNQQGRYPVHFHHLIGPEQTPANGYQFTFEDNSVFCLMNQFTFRWGVTVHDSHYGLIEGNVAYNWAGAGILTETGNEIGNVFEHNFAFRISGTGQRDNTGRDGVAFWFHGPDNYVRDNVAADILSPGPYSYGFSVTPEFLGEVMQPAFQGADPHRDGEGVLRDMNAIPVREFARNEAYGASCAGFTLWWLGAYGATDDAWIRGTAGTVSDLRVWNVYGFGLFLYPTAGLRVERYTAVGDIHHTDPDNYAGTAITISDYDQKGLVIADADIRGYQVGIQAPPYSRGETRIEGGYLYNTVDITNESPWSVHGGADLPAKKLVIDGTRFDLLEANRFSAPFTIQMQYRADYGSNLIQSDETYVYNYDGEPGDNFRIYYPQQRPSFVVPRTGANLKPHDTDWPWIGSPVAGLTNLQTWLKYGIAIAGHILPVGPQLDMSEIDGIVMPMDAGQGLVTPVITGISDDTGTPGDFVTKDRQLIVRGSAEPGARVALFRGTTNVGMVTANKLGTWSIVAYGILADGHYTFAAVSTKDTRASGRSASLEVEVRGKPPAAPAITGWGDDTAAADRITADNSPEIHGTAPATATIEVKRNGKVVALVQADDAGQWSYTSPAVADGQYTFVARTVDLAPGVYSSASKLLTIAVDTLIPVVPVLSGPSGQLTNARPTFTWRVTRPAARYQIDLTDLIGGAVMTLTQTTTTFRPATALSKSSYSIRVRGISRTGLVGDFSEAKLFTIV